MVESLLSIVDISEKFIKKMKIESEKQYQLLDINVIKSVLYNGICKVVQLILTQKQSKESKDFLEVER